MNHLYRQVNPSFEYHFHIETSTPLTTEELATLKSLLGETFEPHLCGSKSFLNDLLSPVIEFGPRMNFETPWSSNAVAICHACGLTKITRIERARRMIVPSAIDQTQFIVNTHDRMTEQVYDRLLTSFMTGICPQPVQTIPLVESGPDALRQANKTLGLGMDEWDINYYHQLFVKRIGRNPTDVECFMLGQVNSEHSRHWFFKG